ncbi:hypothetical protein [Sulfurimonas microaerophilic]|uniref:hypothetical protein n=1 Tax=Sulfurimonas microaerophilic TaxID=3058392 RepID=UPI0027146EBE|nr:hypothetical protein [Sulfurimonas sp. hsl 1-7]
MKDLETQELGSTPKTISGIDTLYYFYETNEQYDDLFLDILDQYEESKARFEKRDLKYENKDINVLINKQTFFFNGKAQGFYWFTHIDSYFTIGFKDYKTNRGLNDIQVQLDARGIYFLGIKFLIQYIDAILVDYITGHKPITRADLNIFVQSDLSWIDKTMFVTRKRKYETLIKERANKHKLETLYIGKRPFLLRLYDKRAELKKSKKKDMMYFHFLSNGFERTKDIYNIEFEMHRDYLKTFKIDTVDDLLSGAEALFKECLNGIRMVDLSSITDNTKEMKNKHRAKTHPLWEHLEKSYILKEFFEIQAPIERIKRKSYKYTIVEAIKDTIAVARKFHIHGGVIDEMFFKDVLDEFKKNHINSIKDKQGVKLVYENVTTQINPRDLDDLELQKYILKLKEDLDSSSDLDIQVLIKKYENAYIELKTRGLDNPCEYPF